MKRLPLILCSAALAVAAVSTQTVSAEARIRAGTLSCDVSGGLGMIITSKRDLICVYKPSRGYSERYYGTIRKYGLDIGKTGRGVMIWGVFISTDGGHRGILAGDYGGVAASATVGVGGGANALVGGSDRSVTLQPFSGEAQTGLSLAAGVASMTLRPVR